MEKKKKMKILSVILCICLVVCAVMNQVGILQITKAADLWSGDLPQPDATYTYTKVNNRAGAGTASNPYKIGTAADLAQLASNVNGGIYPSASLLYFEMLTDINLNSYEWTAIGKGNNTFKGIFNGNGHSIAGLSITLNATKNTDQGLFGYIQDSTISNLRVSGDIRQETATGTNIGGIVGYAYNSTLTDCGFSGRVSGNIKVGGVAGVCSGKTTESVLNGCYNTAEVNATSKCAGGVVGEATNNVTIINSYNKGPVTLTTSGTDIRDSVAGIAGYVENADIVNCYNSGAITGSYIAGGLANCGTSKYAALKNCYNIGTIIGIKAGALSGYFPNTTEIDNSFYLLGSSTEDVSGGYTGTSANVGTFSSYTSALQKISSVAAEKWSLDNKTLKQAMDLYVTKAVAKYSTIREWQDDSDYVNQGYPILSSTVGHVHDRNGGTTIKKEATCTDKGIVVYKCSKCDYTITDSINALGHDYQTVVSDAACEVSGTATQVCSRCQNVGGVQTIPAKGHSIVEFTKEATCTEDGYSVNGCENCTYRDELTRVISPAKGHSEVRTVSSASCTVDEIISYTCDVCSNVRRETGATLALGHYWDNVDGIYRAATCREIGGHIRTCQRKECGLEQFIGEEEPLAAHKWITSGAVAATCTESGYTNYSCGVCKITMHDDYVLPKGHTYRTKIVEPTCAENGYTRHTCVDCEAFYDDAQTATTAHQYVVDSVTAPSCLEDGLRVYKCETCGIDKKETIPAFGSHTYEIDEENSVEQTCTEGGYSLHVCSFCGANKKENVTTSGFGHTYEEKIIKPSCIDDGYTLNTCATCGDFNRSNETKALGHSYSASVVEATTTTRGYTDHVCGRCDDSFIDSYIAAIPNASYDGAREVLILTDMEEIMYYSLNGGDEWISSESLEVSVAAVDIDFEKGIQVIRPGNNIIPVSDSAVQLIQVEKPKAPDGINSIAPETKDGTGIIYGVNETMEYRFEPETVWTPVSGSSIENLQHGTYYVRIKANGSNVAGEEIEVVIEEYVEPTATPKPTVEPTATPAPTQSVKPTPSSDETPGPSYSPNPSASVEPEESADPSAKPTELNPSGNTNNSGNKGTPDDNGNSGNTNNSGNKNNPNSPNVAATSSAPGASGVITNDVYYSSNGTTDRRASTTARTGDENNAILWFALLGVSLMALTAVRKRKKVSDK